MSEVPTIQRWWQRNRVIAPVGTESMTDTSFGNDTDINKIVARFSRTGVLPEGPSTQPYYGDVTHLQGDLTGLLEKTKKGREALAEVQAQQKAEAEAKAAKDAEDLARYRQQEKEAGAPSPED